jgi:FkbM family methyltransferase
MNDKHSKHEIQENMSLHPTGRPPLALSIAKKMIRSNIRGGRFLIDLMRPYWQNRTVDYALTPQIQFTVPVGRRESCLDAQDLREYEQQHVECFCNAIAKATEVTLFDCGADIGLFSASVCSRSSNIRQVLAFEPNQDVREIFALNISRLPNGEAHDSAVSDFSGFGILARPEYDSSPHARYLVRADSGFSVTTIDDYRVQGDIGIKIDVEGGELAVMRGATDTIRNARNVAISFEAHPQVIGRTHIQPNECMRFLQSLRPFRFLVAETDTLVTPDSFQLPAKMVNIVAQSV